MSSKELPEKRILVNINTNFNPLLFIAWLLVLDYSNPAPLQLGDKSLFKIDTHRKVTSNTPRIPCLL